MWEINLVESSLECDQIEKVPQALSMSSSVRPSEPNALGAVGIPSSSGVSVEMTSQHLQAATPTLNNLLRGETSSYIHPQGSQLQMPPHMQHIMGPPQGAFHSPVVQFIILFSLSFFFFS
ncbi:unnamed protein product [Enterobius vermicularis]|uniref:HNF1 homeobox B n=1 Tax=Enterobius vermicularis TaxID=51028 RepID=A0A0N4UTP6_ENTVE|nr:unnamed protein product [Enterobius vermicularis]